MEKEKSDNIDLENIFNTYEIINDQQKKSNKENLDKDNYEIVAPIEVNTVDLVLSVAMRKDYQLTIMNSIIEIANHQEEIPGYGDYPYFRINPTVKFIPKITNFNSEILSERQLKEIHMNIPYYMQYKNLKLLYSATKHGISMKQFYMNTLGEKITILVIKDDNQHILGGYLSESIRNSQKFYGTGETFVFSFHNSERLHTYPATMENEYFIYSDDDVIALGCDDTNFSISIRDEFLKGCSHTTKTFKNPILASGEEFFILKFEIYGFED